jgi:hypothetical protein
MGETMRHFSGIAFSTGMIEAHRKSVISMSPFLMHSQKAPQVITPAQAGV